MTESGDTEMTDQMTDHAGTSQETDHPLKTDGVDTTNAVMTDMTHMHGIDRHHVVGVMEVTIEATIGTV